MYLPPSVEASLRDCFKRLAGCEPSAPLSVRTASGGSINQAAIVTCRGERLFVKWNRAHTYPGMFEAEAKGLQLLSSVGGALVPDVVAVEQDEQLAWLVLEAIEPGHGSSRAATRLGEMLARMHQQTHRQFGLDHHNYMGSLTQSNRHHATWHDFFIGERLSPQIAMGQDNGMLSGADRAVFEKLFLRLLSLVPHEPPALVHGDLWSGNFLWGAGDQPWLIDPAVAYNHRETDIAMSMLFGGFPHTFYEAYHHHYPLEPGWKQRVEIHQLYPLLVHLNLFGSGYRPQITAILRRFAG